MCSVGFQSGWGAGGRGGHGRPGKSLHIAVGDELCGVACCMGSGVVKLKYSAVQSLNARNKPANKYPFLFFE